VRLVVGFYIFVTYVVSFILENVINGHWLIIVFYFSYWISYSLLLFDYEMGYSHVDGKVLIASAIHIVYRAIFHSEIRIVRVVPDVTSLFNPMGVGKTVPG
jgi:hypothetical protein